MMKKRVITGWRQVVVPRPARARRPWLALRRAKPAPRAMTPSDASSSDRWDSEGGRLAAPH
jgi:hypothetical protein